MQILKNILQPREFTLFALVDHSGETEKVGMKMRSTKLLIFGSPKAPSIQRLGGLKLPSSRGALHIVIENGNDTESKWAVYAALRTGDVSVLPRVKQLLAVGDRQLPESAIASQLRFHWPLSIVTVTLVLCLIALRLFSRKVNSGEKLDNLVP